MGSKVLTEMNMNIAILWDAEPCSSLLVHTFLINLSPKPHRGTSPKITIFTVHKYKFL
jgi:hypothetical protein